MSTRVIAVFCVAASVFLLVSCKSWQKSWQALDSSFYPEKVELDKDPGWPESEVEAAHVFAQVDQGLQRLLLELELQETLPDQGWAENVLQGQPWLQGLLVVDKEGEIQQGNKARDLPEGVVQEVLSRAETWQDDDLRLVLPHKGEQTWMVLARPYQQGRQWQGLILAYFQPQAMLKKADNPDQIILLSKEQVLWDGDYPQAANKALEQDWSGHLQDEAYGQIRVADQEFYWLSRYVGQDPIFYLLAK
ncbi:MAG: hypothetical protein ACOC3Y_03590 [Desulfohalobiaceae bacterium]